MTIEKQLSAYQKNYNSAKLIDKLKRNAARLGSGVVIQILTLSYLVAGNQAPLKIRLLVMAALGYFILPTDLISDFIPALGFTDDLAFLTYAFTQATKYITPEIKQKAQMKLHKWFPTLQAEKEAKPAANT